MKMLIVKKLCSIVLSGILFGVPLVGYSWTVSEDFDGGVPGRVVQDSSDIFTDAATKTFYSHDIAYSGAGSAVLNIEKGDPGFGRWGGRMMFPQKLSEGDQVWVRLRTYMPRDFNYSTNFALKFLRLHVADKAGGHLGYTDIYISSDGSYRYQNELYTTNKSVVLFGKNNPVEKGVWETVIYNVKYSANSASVKFWKEVGGTINNGKRIGGQMKLLLDEKEDLTLKASSNMVDAFLLFTYWNGASPQTQHMYVDDLMVSTVPPPELAGNTTTPPEPPSDIK